MLVVGHHVSEEKGLRESTWAKLPRGSYEGFSFASTFWMESSASKCKNSKSDSEFPNHDGREILTVRKNFSQLESPKRKLGVALRRASTLRLANSPKEKFSNPVCTNCEKRRFPASKREKKMGDRARGNPVKQDVGWLWLWFNDVQSVLTYYPRRAWRAICHLRR